MFCTCFYLCTKPYFYVGLAPVKSESITEEEAASAAEEKVEMEVRILTLLHLYYKARV